MDQEAKLRELEAEVRSLRDKLAAHEREQSLNFYLATIVLGAILILVLLR